jgi:Ca2+-binding RTX toxin-like protein
MIENPGEGTDRVLASVSYVLPSTSVEQLTTTSHQGTAAIDLTGNGLDNLIIGNDGANRLHGGGGDDVIVARAGNDFLYGDAGADTLYGNAGNDLNFVDAGDQVVELTGEGNDRVFASGSLVLWAGAEIETLSTSNDAGTAAIDLTGNGFANPLIGNDGANRLHGRGGDDLIVARAGNDFLYGDAGADTLYGSAGNDFYFVDSGDQVVELTGEGNDRVFASASFTLTAGVEIETLSTDNDAGTAAINLTGNGFANSIYGNAGANVLDGRGGADLMAGRAGDDFYYIDNNFDVVVEVAGQGNDRVFASVSYTLTAGASVELMTTTYHAGTDAINLTGNELANTIQGNDGANVLDGKGGNDTLIGLAGADTFAFTTALGAGNVDFISGFEHGVDKIALDDAIFTAIGGLGALDSNAFVTGFSAADASDRIIYDSTSGRLFYDADGLGGATQVQIASLNGSLPLTASDFVVS